MTRLTRLAIGVGLIALLAGSAACATTINKVLADPAKYRDREVTISGTVAQSFSAANRGVYRVQDDSGQMWVISEHGVPRNGAHVSVKGTIREGFNLGSLGGLVNLPPGSEDGSTRREVGRRDKIEA